MLLLPIKMSTVPQRQRESCFERDQLTLHKYFINQVVLIDHPKRTLINSFSRMIDERWYMMIKCRMI